MMITGKLKCLLVLLKARQGAFMEANFEFSPNTTPLYTRKREQHNSMLAVPAFLVYTFVPSLNSKPK